MICQTRHLELLFFLAAFHRKSSPHSKTHSNATYSKFYTNNRLRAKKSTWLPLYNYLAHTLHSSHIIINFVWWKGNHEQNTHNDDVVEFSLLTVAACMLCFKRDVKKKKSSKVNKIDLHVPKPSICFVHSRLHRAQFRIHCEHNFDYTLEHRVFYARSALKTLALSN